MSKERENLDNLRRVLNDLPHLEVRVQFWTAGLAKHIMPAQSIQNIIIMDSIYSWWGGNQVVATSQSVSSRVPRL
jgi:hypothetical protein